MVEFRSSVPHYMTDSIVEGFRNMDVFKDVNSIPDIPRVDEKTYEEVIVPNLIRCGAIPKSELQTGKVYEGKCRNASEAMWVVDHFVYKRHQYGMEFYDKINHFQDDDGYDVFVPIKLKN